MRNYRLSVIHKTTASADHELAKALKTALESEGHQVFVDERTIRGIEWAMHVEKQIRESDLVVVLLSSDSVRSEMLAYQIELADLANLDRDGRPEVLPIRMNYPARFPEPIGNLLRTREFVWQPEHERFEAQLINWRSPSDDSRVVDEIQQRLALFARAERPARPVPLDQGVGEEEKASSTVEPVGGAVPLKSPYYIVRPADQTLMDAISRRHSIVLIKGSRQMGKTSLLGRGVDKAREAGMAVVITDFQKLPQKSFESLETFYRSLAEMISSSLHLEHDLDSIFREERSPNTNFELFWSEAVFGTQSGPILWGCDEFDRLLGTDFSSEVCGLIRSWHNDRVLDPDGPWGRLSVAIAYATESRLFIKEINQSPFNVGTHIQLWDFNREQVSDLNRRFGEPIDSEPELDAFMKLLGGQPYLTRCGLQHMKVEQECFEDLLGKSLREDFIFNDHLSRVVLLIGSDELLRLAIRRVMDHGECDRSDFVRLRSAGIVRGESHESVTLRCELYAQYLSKTI